MRTSLEEILNFPPEKQTCGHFKNGKFKRFDPPKMLEVETIYIEPTGDRNEHLINYGR
jgi:hypothetical protein